MLKNKIIILIVVVAVVLTCVLLFSLKIKPVKVEGVPYFDFINQKELNVNDIESIDYIRYTEGGDNSVTYTDNDKINSLYNVIKNTKIGEETNRACEDNTTVYILNMKDGSKYKVEYECDWVVIGNKRYEIVKDQ